MSFFHPQTILVLTGSNCSILTEENYSLLNKQEKKRAAEFLFDQDRVQYVICRTLLKQLLSLITKIPTHQISIRESLNGKPYLNKSNIFFNLSHSANNVAIAVTDLGPIGIDIENKNKTFDYLKLSNLIFSENEQEQFFDIHPHQRKEAFLNAWTRKEAFFKATGSGLSSPLKELEVPFIPNQKPVICKTAWDTHDRHEWFLTSFDFIKECVGALAVKTQKRNPVVINYSLKDFYNYRKQIHHLNAIHHFSI